MLKSLLCVIVFVATAAIVTAIERTAFDHLVIVKDEPVVDVLADKIEWSPLPDGGLVIGGWQNWPDTPCVIIAGTGRDGRRVRLPQPALAEFAVSPSGKQIAYWARGTNKGRVQLTVTGRSGNNQRTVGQGRAVTGDMQLAWLNATDLCVLTRTEGSCKAWIVDTNSGQWQEIADVDGGEWGRLKNWRGWEPIAVWAGNDGSKRCFLLRRPQACEVSADLSYDRARPDDSLYSYFGPDGALWIGGHHRQQEAKKIAADAGAACWSPDGNMMIYSTAGQLQSLWAASAEKRKLIGSVMGQDKYRNATINVMNCSPDGRRLAYCIQGPEFTEVRHAALGLERIFVYLRFNGDIQLSAGQTVWVVKKLKYDDSDKPIEPDWPTLKAKLRIEKQLGNENGQTVRAVNVGRQGGVLQRIADVSSVNGEFRPLSDIRSHQMLKPAGGLHAWVQGTDTDGRVTGVEVRRQPLTAEK